MKTPFAFPLSLPCILLLFFTAITFAEDRPLPQPRREGGKPVFEAIRDRHSDREILDTPLDEQAISDLLWVAYGFNRENMRVIPTALNRQELDVYAVLKDGVYLYDAKENRLRLVASGDHRPKAGKQEYVATAPLNLIYVADRTKETDTGAYISVGCAVQNVYLACVSKGLACRVRTSIDKDVLHELLALRPEQEALAGQTIAHAQNPKIPPFTEWVPGHSLPRAASDQRLPAEVVENFLTEIRTKKMDLHSIMVVQDGRVVCEKWFGDNAPDKNHVMWSVSKTFTSMAVGFAVAEGRFTVEDKVVSFFPDELPDEVPPHLAALRVKDLLTMSVGHDSDPTGVLPFRHEDREKGENANWEKRFLGFAIPHEPGTKFVYNSLATYMLSSIIQKTTGRRLSDYLRPRLFEPLGIDHPVWDRNFQGVDCGGWGLHVRTEDMAKLGLLLLQKGKWNGQQLLPEAWIEEATAPHILQNPAVDPAASESDWLQGYGYQIWRCRHGGFRADGKDGQFIVVLPKENAVVVLTANIGNMQAELNLVWDHLLPALRSEAGQAIGGSPLRTSQP